MQFFELHFNPKARRHPATTYLAKGEAPDLIFDSFCYEPENIYEKRLGSLFVVGELKNVLPQNLKFLSNIAGFLKKQYYSAKVKFSPETALKESLKTTNEFLERIAKGGDVSWLGNLNLAVFNLISRQKPWLGFELNFTKVGTIKTLLLRASQIIDIGKNLEFSEIEPYPLKIFGNIVSGKLAEGDLLLVLTEDVFSVFTEGQVFSEKRKLKSKKDKNKFFQPVSLIERIAAISPFDEKKLRMVLKTEEKKLLEVSGICLLCVLTKEIFAEKKTPTAFTFQKEAEKFSIQQVFLPLIDKVKNLSLIFKRELSRVKGLLKKFLKTPASKILVWGQAKIKLKVGVPKIKISLAKPEIRFFALLKKNIVLLLLLILFTTLGFFIFQKQEEKTSQRYQAILTSVSEDITQAENFLLLKNEKKAFDILKKVREEILPIIKTKSAVQREAEVTKNLIEEKLKNISKLEKISSPEVLFEFEQKEFMPQKMVFFKENLYFFSPYSKDIFKLGQDAKKTILETEEKFNMATVIDDSLLFFKKPGLVSLLRNDRFEESFTIKSPYPDFTPQSLAVFLSNLYFLDGKNGEIVKYPAPLSQGKDSPQVWLKPKVQKVTGAKSISVDGSVWILNKNDTTSRYYGGSLQETITLDLFPPLKDLSKISAQTELLYLLEPIQKRIIILTKKGEVLKQFQSEKFDNLKDFAVSEDGKTIYLLNGLKVYQIKF